MISYGSKEQPKVAVLILEDFVERAGGTRKAFDDRRYLGLHIILDVIKKAYGIEAELVSEPGKLAAALKRCARAMRDGRPYLLDVKIARYFEGSDSDWHDFYSVARKLPRQS